MLDLGKRLQLSHSIWISVCHKQLLVNKVHVFSRLPNLAHHVGGFCIYFSVVVEGVSPLGCGGATMVALSLVGFPCTEG